MLSHLMDSIPFLKPLAQTERSQLLPLFIERNYKRGSILFFEEDYGDELYIVKSGAVKIYRLKSEKEVLLALFGEGDYFGEMAIVQSNQVRSATAETLQPTTLYVLKRKDFVDFLKRNPEAVLSLLDTVMQRLRRTNEIIEDLSVLDVRTRVYRALIRLADDFGVPHTDGILIDMKMTHQQLADMVGSRRDSITRVLLELQEEGLIEIHQKRILLQDRMELEARTGLE